MSIFPPVSPVSEALFHAFDNEVISGVIEQVFVYAECIHPQESQHTICVCVKFLAFSPNLVREFVAGTLNDVCRPWLGRVVLRCLVASQDPFEVTCKYLSADAVLRPDVVRKSPVLPLLAVAEPDAIPRIVTLCTMSYLVQHDDYLLPANGPGYPLARARGPLWIPVLYRHTEQCNGLDEPGMYCWSSLAVPELLDTRGGFTNPLDRAAVIQRQLMTGVLMPFFYPWTELKKDPDRPHLFIPRNAEKVPV